MGAGTGHQKNPGDKREPGEGKTDWHSQQVIVRAIRGLIEETIALWVGGHDRVELFDVPGDGVEDTSEHSSQLKTNVSSELWFDPRSTYQHTP